MKRMEDVLFIKLRLIGTFCRLRLQLLWLKITGPFQIAFVCIKRYLLLRKIDKESKDRWERYVKFREIENQDKIESRRNQFYFLKSQLIAVFVITSICAGSCDGLQEQPNEVDNSRKEFQNNKEELISLVEKISNYDEITFDENIKSGIIAWEFGMFETQEELINWVKSFFEYIATLTLDI